MGRHSTPARPADRIPPRHDSGRPVPARAVPRRAVPRRALPGRRVPSHRLLLAGVVAALLVAGLVSLGPLPYHSTVRGTGVLAAGSAPNGPAARGPTTQAAPAGPAQVTMAFAGDVHFAGRTAGRAGLGADVLGPIGRRLAAADIGMVNLESAITERGTEEPKQFHFRAPPAALDSLRRSGVDVVTMANNHAVDYGPVGLSDTLAAIASHRLPVVGVGADAAHAYAPWYSTVRGVRVAIIAASQIHDRTMAAWTAGPTSPGIASATSERLVASVRAARQRATVVVVYLHWGTEGRDCPNAEQRQVAGQLADAGADAVVGTHAHLLLGGGWLGSTYVDYGLGNFLWWLDDAYSNDTGVLTLTFRDRQVVRSDFAPAEIDSRGVPLPATGTQARRILGKLEQLRGCAGVSARPGA
jgi:poly-gamma-glutamate synthesis protein (capsule biosynthesis protein)